MANACSSSPESSSQDHPRPVYTPMSEMAERELLLGRVNSAIERIPPLSEVVQDLLHLAESERATNRDFVFALQKDPVLVARLFKVANSSFYRRVVAARDIEDVVRRLGPRSIVNIVSSLSVSKAIGRRGGGVYGYEENGLWRHSFCVAHVSQKLSGLLRHSGSSFLAGLTHEIGKIVMDAVMSESAQDVRFDTEHDEYQVFGIDHAELGSRIAARWELPAAVAEAVHNHHALEDLEFAKDAAIVSLADKLIDDLGVGMQASPNEAIRNGSLSSELLLVDAPVYSRAMGILGLKSENLDTLVEKLVPLVSSVDDLSVECVM